MCRIYRRKHGLKRHQRNTNGHNSGPRRSVFRVRDGSRCRAFCATRTWCPAVCPSRRLVQTCPRSAGSLVQRSWRLLYLCIVSFDRSVSPVHCGYSPSHYRGADMESPWKEISIEYEGKIISGDYRISGTTVVVRSVRGVVK